MMLAKCITSNVRSRIIGRDGGCCNPFMGDSQYCGSVGERPRELAPTIHRPT